MITYDYRCLTCGEEFSKLMKLSDPKPNCPKCSSEDVNKVLTAPLGVTGSGGGWYGKGGSK